MIETSTLHAEPSPKKKKSSVSGSYTARDITSHALGTIASAMGPCC